MVARVAVTLSAGVVSLLFAFLWPCAWICKKAFHNHNYYSLLLIYFGLLSLLYAAVTGALAVTAKDEYGCIPHCHCPFNKTYTISDPCVYLQVPFWSLIGLLTMVLAFISLGCISCYCCNQSNNRRRAGSYDSLS